MSEVFQIHQNIWIWPESSEKISCARNFPQSRFLQSQVIFPGNTTKNCPEYWFEANIASQYSISTRQRRLGGVTMGNEPSWACTMKPINQCGCQYICFALWSGRVMTLSEASDIPKSYYWIHKNEMVSAAASKTKTFDGNFAEQITGKSFTYTSMFVLERSLLRFGHKIHWVIRIREFKQRHQAQIKSMCVCYNT